MASYTRVAFVAALTLSIPCQAFLPTLGSSVAQAEGLDSSLQEKLAPKFASLRAWAASSEIVNAVKSHNSNTTPEAKAMTQEKWKGLGVLDAFARSFTKGPAATFLKTQQSKDDAVTEAFVSGQDGTKVGFLSKPSNWSHKGKPKHEVPLTGKEWTGPVEIDESTGAQQIQISVPVLDGGKPIGSLVVGFSVIRLKK